MKGIGQFFDKFNSGALKEIRKREWICEIIKEYTQQEIKIEDITFLNKIIKIKGSSGLKSQILIKKNSILEKISSKISHIEDIQ